MTFTHLHVRSNYSLLYGANHVDELVAAAGAMGYRSLALTDINNLYGVHAFVAACRREGVKPVIGAEVQGNGERAVVLVKDREGFSNLSTLLTRHLKQRARPLKQRANHPAPKRRENNAGAKCNAYGATSPLASLLQKYGRGTVVLSDSPALLKACAGRVPELYGMLTGLSNAIPNLAGTLGLPLAASGEVAFVTPADRAIHRILRTIARRTVLGTIADNELANLRACLAPPEQMEQRFALWPEALENTAVINRSCRFSSIYNGLVFPRSVPVGGESPADTLIRQARYGVRRRYGGCPPQVEARLEYELDIIIKKGFASYFLVVADIAALATRTCGRGSAAASLVAYSLGITNVDPVRHNLYFERFLNPEREDPPDIDVDFAWDERDAIVERVREKYGDEHCAFVCNHVGFKRRSAFREVARCFGMPETEITRVSRYISRLRHLQGHGTPDARVALPEALDDPWPEIMRIARRITGFPRCLSVHVGGVVITPRPTSCYVPVETAPKGVPIITWEKDGTEESGLVKIDLLCNRSLGVVRDTLANVEQNGVVIDPGSWNPIDDKKTQALLARGDTIGVFYVESPAMRQLQKKTRRGDFEHLVIHSSIIRPAANRYINEYVERLGGKHYEPLHPALGELLSETYGVMCYQEDVSKAAVALAGFSPGEADGLRKILSKKDKRSTVADYRERFSRRARQRGIAEETIAKIWNMMESFSGYSFCKPHSASYAQVSFQSAYLKAHHPAEFMAAVLSNGGGYYSSAAYISEARRLGITVVPPDVNRSQYRYVARNGVIQVGFMAVSGFRDEIAREIEIERARNGHFTTLDDFLRRISVSMAEIESLVDAGALDSLPGAGSRPAQLWSAVIHKRNKNTVDTQGTLFATKTAVPELPSFDGPDELGRLLREYRSLGFLCDRHPLFLVKGSPEARDFIKGHCPIMARKLHYYNGQEVTVVGWPVTRKTIYTARGEVMEFVSFEDESDIYETVLFPSPYRRFSHLVSCHGDEPSAVLVSGRVERDHGAVYLNVNRLDRIPHSSLLLG